MAVAGQLYFTNIPDSTVKAMNQRHSQQLEVYLQNGNKKYTKTSLGNGVS
jgi:hypothetical protein